MEQAGSGGSLIVTGGSLHTCPGGIWCLCGLEVDQEPLNPQASPGSPPPPCGRSTLAGQLGEEAKNSAPGAKPLN